MFTVKLRSLIKPLYNSTHNALSREELSTFLYIDTNSTTEYPKMYLSVSKLTGKVTAHGRIFCTITFTY